MTTTPSWSSRLRRRWWLVGIAGAAGVLLGVVAQTAHHATYTATVIVRTAQRYEPLSARTPLDLLRPYARLAGPPTTSLLEISFTAPSPLAAVRGAAAAARSAVLEARAATDATDAQAYERALADVHAVRRELTAAIRSESRQAPGSSRHSDAVAERQALQTELATAADRLAALTSRSRPTAQITSGPVVPGADATPVSGRWWTWALAGLSAGVILALRGLPRRRVGLTGFEPATP